jgi:CBS domain-containing protein
LLKVAEAMAARDLVSATPSTPMSEAARLMLRHDINLLPVTEAGRVVGIVTRHDVLRGLYSSHSPFLA